MAEIPDVGERTGIVLIVTNIAFVVIVAMVLMYSCDVKKNDPNSVTGALRACGTFSSQNTDEINQLIQACKNRVMDSNSEVK